MLKVQSSVIALCAALTCMGAATAAHAQVTAENDAAGGLDDIVVTAQKRSERLQDVPIAVTAISGETLAAKGVTNVLDAITVTPGLNYTQITGSAAPRIRGIGSSTALGGNENAVSTYVDGVYYASPTSSVLSLNNIEQISVLKGPQGTLFGRNATGGLIQITTKDPRQEFGGNANLGYGNRNTIDGSLYVTGGLAPTLAADLAIFYHNQQDGFGRNLTTGTEVNKSRDFNVRSKWKLEAGDNTSFLLALDYGKMRSINPARRPTFAARPSVGPRFTGGAYDIYSPIDPLYRNRQGGVSLTATHHFDGVDLVSISAYRKSRSYIAFHLDGTIIANNFLTEEFHERQISQELQLISKSDGPLSWTLGAYYFNNHGGYYDLNFNIPPLTQLYDTRQNVESFAGYAQASYKLGDATSLTAGIRYTNEKKTFTGSGINIIRATGAVVRPVPVAARQSVSRPTWRLALDHHLDRDVLIYVSYNRGFKSGGFNSAVYETVQSFKPETLDAYEAGLKSDLLDRRLRINSSAFYYNYKNIQLTRFVGGLPLLSNGPKARIYGLDLDLTARPADRLTLSAGLSYIHGRFGSFPNAQISTPLPAGGNSQTQGSASGNRIPLTPDWTIDLGLDYVVPLSSSKLLFSAHYFHSDGWRPEPDNRLQQKPYNLLSSSLKWEIGDEARYSLTVWGKNLTNEAYATQLQTQGRTDTVTIAAGRTFGGTLGVKF
jgi:iron complex outermembrane recepter protein